MSSLNLPHPALHFQNIPDSKVLQYLLKDSAVVDPYEREVAGEIIEAVREVLVASPS
jgi:hypothetical protein